MKLQRSPVKGPEFLSFRFPVCVLQANCAKVVPFLSIRKANLECHYHWHREFSKQIFSFLNLNYQLFWY